MFRSVRRALGALVLGLCMAQPAAAFEFRGAELRLDYNRNAGFDQSTLVPSGSVEFGFGPGLRVQFDALQTIYSTGAVGYRNIGLHLGYAITPDTVVGAFYTREHVGTTFTSAIRGLELLHRGGGAGSLPAYRIEAWGGRYGSIATIYSADLEVAVWQGVSAFGGVTRGIWFGNPQNRLSIGARYRGEGGLFLEAAAHRYSGVNTTLSLAIGYSFGEGVTFRPRSYGTIDPGW